MRKKLVIGTMIGFLSLTATSAGYLAYKEADLTIREWSSYTNIQRQVSLVSPIKVQGSPEPEQRNNKGKVDTVDEGAITEKVTAYTLVLSESQKVADLYLGTEIYSPDVYVELSRNLKAIQPDSVVYLHLIGDGGSAAGYLYVVNILKETKARIIPVVDGNIASAHAFLALSFDDQPQIGKSLGYIYFHSVSSTNEWDKDCKDATGTDRGYSAKQKCLENSVALANMYNEYIYAVSAKWLTEDEIARMKQGRDVIIPLEIFKQRLTNG